MAISRDPLERRPPRLPEVVADRLQELILETGLQPGDRMPTEPVLAARYDVSRQVIREAARLLDQRGLVDIRPGRGMTVTRLGTDGVGDIYRLLLRFDPGNFAGLMEVRRILEPGIAAMAAQRRTDDDVAAMRLILDEAAAHLDDFDRCLALDLAFHDRVSTSTQNALITQIAAPVNTTLREVYREPTAYLAAQPHTLEEHRGILDALERRAPEEAAALTLQHLDRIEHDGRSLVPDAAAPATGPTTPPGAGAPEAGQRSE